MDLSANRAQNGDAPGDQNFEEFDIAEDELIDAYVRGELSIQDRKALEKGLRNSPELVARLHFARLLSQAVDRRAGVAEAVSDQVPEKLKLRPPKWWPFWLTLRLRPAFALALAATALIIIGGVGLLAGWIRLRHDSQQLAAQQAALNQQKLELQKSVDDQRLMNEQIRTQLKERLEEHEADQKLIAALRQAQNQQSTNSPATVATLFLLPGLRSSEENPFKLPAGTSRIRLQLAVEPIAYVSFLAQIKNSQDNQIFQKTLRSPRSGKLVTITIPSKMLTPGVYTLQLSGTTLEGQTEPVHNYTFRIASSTSNK